MTDTPKKMFSEAMKLARPADLLLYRGTGWASRGIRLASLSPYSHAGMLSYRRGPQGEVPVLIDVVQWRGGRDVDLEEEITRHPGAWDLFRIDTSAFPDFNREAAQERMWRFRGINYGWWELGKASLIFLPLFRLFQKIDRLRIEDKRTCITPPFCSMAYAIACEAGGVDPVNELKHSMTTPGHLGQSKLFIKTCTIVPDLKV